MTTLFLVLAAVVLVWRLLRESEAERNARRLDEDYKEMHGEN